MCCYGIYVLLLCVSHSVFQNLDTFLDTTTESKTNFPGWENKVHRIIFGNLEARNQKPRNVIKTYSNQLKSSSPASIVITVFFFLLFDYFFHNNITCDEDFKK